MLKIVTENGTGDESSATLDLGSASFVPEQLGALREAGR